MPSYEYECQDCGKTFTVEQRMKDHIEKGKPKCPSCQKSRGVRQLVSAVHVQTSKKS